MRPSSAAPAPAPGSLSTARLEADSLVVLEADGLVVLAAGAAVVQYGHYSE
ncbi:MAG: hypothetical protein M3498_12815 [Deinococcota bacterium]|nr:hypothetical protein [Deinococcota bacterium]